MPRIDVYPDAGELATQAARVFSDLAENAIAERGRFAVALSGGSTPKRMFEQLAKMVIDWRHIHLFWVDERCVPPDHPDSNFGMTAEVLLNQIEIPGENVHRIHGELPPEQAVLIYEKELRHFFGDQLPVFDLILLGLGSDGHTASLFPGSPALQEKKRWVIEVKHSAPPPPLVDRVTLTFPVLKQAREVIFLVSGKEKSAILSKIFKSPSISEVIPVLELSDNKSNTRWFLDSSSAAGWYKS
jgi:6-phosphogluconolactonase